MMPLTVWRTRESSYGKGAVAEGGKDGGQVLFSRVVLSAPLLHGLQALTEIVLFRHQGFQFRVVRADA